MRTQSTVEYLLSLGEVVLLSLIVAGGIVAVGYLVGSVSESLKPVLWRAVP